VGYHPKHKRVYRARGKASEHACVDCSGPAEDWSWVHDTDGSDLNEHRQPRCRRCHKAYDGQTGENKPNAKLSWAKVDAIRAAKGVSQRELARQHGVSHTTIRTVLNNQAWVR
jgi:transposase-like protein